MNLASGADESATLTRILDDLRMGKREAEGALFDGKIDVPDADAEWRPAAARPREWAAITAMATTGEVPFDDSADQ